MFTLRCQSCGQSWDFEREPNRGVVRCRDCGARIFVADGQKKSSGLWVVWLVLGPLALMVLSVLLCVGYVSRSANETNATCPMCGQRTFLSMRHVAENRDTPCFKCGAVLPAAMFNRE